MSEHSTNHSAVAASVSAPARLPNIAAARFVPPQVRRGVPNVSTEDLAQFGHSAAHNVQKKK